VLPPDFDTTIVVFDSIYGNAPLTAPAELARFMAKSPAVAVAALRNVRALITVLPCAAIDIFASDVPDAVTIANKRTFFPAGGVNVKIVPVTPDAIDDAPVKNVGRKPLLINCDNFIIELPIY
jgi:hypothetical protein